MTQEEAIEFLSHYIDNESYTVKCQEAHRMTISALRSVGQEQMNQMNKVCKGKWLYNKKGQLVCSCCGFHPTYSHNSNENTGMSNCRFCPNCSAKMK